MIRIIDALFAISILVMIMGILFGAEYNLFHSAVVILLALNLYKAERG